MRIADWPVWMQRIYWYFHGPIGNPQHHMKGYSTMSQVVWFLAIEAILGVCILLGIWFIDWIGAQGTLNKCLKALIVIALGAAMIVKLFAFAGV